MAAPGKEDNDSFTVSIYLKDRELMEIRADNIGAAKGYTDRLKEILDIDNNSSFKAPGN